MEPDNLITRKIKAQATLNYLVGVFLIVSVVVFSIVVIADIILALALIVVGFECILTGIIAKKAANSPSIYTASRYSRIQFINWIVWIVIGGLSEYLIVLSIIYEESSNAVIIVVTLLTLSLYFGFCYLFYIFLKNAKKFLNDFAGLYREASSDSSGGPIINRSYPQPEFNGQVVYPGQAYHGVPSPEVYRAQPVFNNPISESERPLIQSSDLQNPSGK